LINDQIKADATIPDADDAPLIQPQWRRVRNVFKSLKRHFLSPFKPVSRVQTLH
jgi:hypothetical protein